MATLPGWRRFKRKRSSWGKGQSGRSPPVWLSSGPSQSLPTCWRRRRTKTFSLSEALLIAVIHFPHPPIYCACQDTSCHASEEMFFLCVVVCDFWWWMMVCDQISQKAKVVPHLAVTLSLLWLKKKKLKKMFTYHKTKINYVFHAIPKRVDFSPSHL